MSSDILTQEAADIHGENATEMSITISDGMNSLTAIISIKHTLFGESATHWSSIIIQTILFHHHLHKG